MITPAAGALMMVSLLQLCSPAAAQAARGAGPPPSCPTSCGNVSVPYPFGIGAGCSWPGFSLTCDRTRLLVGGGGTLQVVEISLVNSTVRVLDTAGQVNLTFDGAVDGNGTWGGAAGPFVLSERRNQFVVTGCNVQATLVGDGGGGNVISGCSSFCSISDKWTGAVTSSPGDGGDATAACSGIGCCETPIPIGRPSYGVRLKWLDETHEYDNQLPIAVRVAERGWFDAASAKLLRDSPGYSASRRPAVPVVLEFAVDSNPVVLPGVATSGCPEDAARSACRSSLSSCRNVTGRAVSTFCGALGHG